MNYPTFRQGNFLTTKGTKGTKNTQITALNAPQANKFQMQRQSRRYIACGAFCCVA
jgi:hypothetical protein